MKHLTSAAVALAKFRSKAPGNGQFAGTAARTWGVRIAVMAMFAGTAPLHVAPAFAAEHSPAVERIANLLEQVRARYVEKIDDAKLVSDALNGVLKGLDPYSKYMDPEAFETLQNQNRGEYGGVGIEVRLEANGARVLTVFDDAPASRAGLKTGDVITRIGDSGLEGLDLDAVTNRMRGKVDSEVLLTVLRGGDGQPEQLTVKRAVVRWQSVRARMIEPGYVYLRVTNFQEHTAEMMAAAIKDLWKSNSGRVLGLVLDLRDNPGGLITAAVGVSTAFLPPNVPIAYADGAGQASKMRLFARKEDYLRPNMPDYLADLPVELKTLPMIVLVNKNSASSSEIVAGALQDHKRATVVGTLTYGKGSIQRMFQQDDGAGLKITTSYYYTPSGRKVNGKGVTPDLLVEKDPAASAVKADSAQPVAAKGDSAQPVAVKTDGVQPAAAKANGAQAMAAVSGDVARSDRGSGTCSAVAKSDAVGAKGATANEDRDCQLEEALRLLRARTTISQR